jgi:hypothetical protein
VLDCNTEDLSAIHHTVVSSLMTKAKEGKEIEAGRKFLFLTPFLFAMGITHCVRTLT